MQTGLPAKISRKKSSMCPQKPSKYITFRKIGSGIFYMSGAFVFSSVLYTVHSIRKYLL